LNDKYPSDTPYNHQKNQSSKHIASNPTVQVNTVIPSHGYLVIWCDKLEPLSQLHASFKLDADGGYVLLTAADESWCDLIVYTAMKGTETVGRYPDGTSHVVAMNVPTIARANIASSYDVEVSQPEQSGITDSTIMAQQPFGQTFNLKGQSVQGRLAPGIYIRNGRKVVVK
jgi:hypothetical protein